MIPSIDTAVLAASLRGQSVSSAGDALRRASAGGAAKIQITPVAMPWLPIFAGNISVQVVVQPH